MLITALGVALMETWLISYSGRVIDYINTSDKSVLWSEYGFELIGLKGEIGALVMGLLLSSHPRASELSNSLWSLKEVFLVGFFLSIGMAGLPDWTSLGFCQVTRVGSTPVVQSYDDESRLDASLRDWNRRNPWRVRSTRRSSFAS